MSDLWPLLWLRGRQWGRAGRYWLAVIGYDPSAGALMDRVYGLYVLAVVAVIAVLAWAGAINAARNIGTSLLAAPAAAGAPSAAATAAWVLARFVPWTVLLAQAALLATALASSPLKFTAPDAAHIAGAPLRRGAVVALAFVRGIPLRLLAPAAIGDLASLILSGSPHHQAAGAATAAALALFTSALAWAVGLLRLARPAPRPWPLPLLAAALLVWALPGVALWPGRALAAAMAGSAPLLSPGLLLATAVALVCLGLAGSSANLTLAVAASSLFARLSSLGPMAWTDPGAQREIRLAARQSHRRARLPFPTATGFPLLPARAVLVYLRRPGLAFALLRDLSLTVLGCWILLGRGAGLPWFDWVFAAAAIPPRGVGDVYEMDTREPFLRQFLPPDDLTLLAGDAAPAALPVLVLALAAWAVRRPAGVSFASGALCAAVLLALRTLLQAVAPSHRREGVWRPPFLVASGIGFGLLAVIAVPAHAPGLALFLGLATAVVLSLVTAGV